MVVAVEMLSANEAALVAHVARRDVDRMIDEHILPDSLISQANGRWVSPGACMFIAFFYGTAKQLTAEERKLAIRTAEPKLGKLWPSRTKVGATKENWVIWNESIGIDMAPFAKATSDRFKRLATARNLVVSDPDILSGTPVIRGTRIPVHDIAANVKSGVSDDDILAAYPALDADKIALSVIYAEANPLMGRKRKSTFLNRANVTSRVRIERFTPIQ